MQLALSSHIERKYAGIRFLRPEYARRKQRQAAERFSEKAVWEEKKHICRSENISIRVLESTG